MKRLTLFLAIFLFALTLQGQKVLTYGGKVLRGYDANTPTSTPYTLAVWLDGKDASSFTLDGTSVDNWADRSGNGNDVANANDDATRPTYDASTGRVTFTRADDTFLQSAAFGAELSQPNTVFIVMKMTDIVTDNQHYFDGIVSTKRNNMYYEDDPHSYGYFAGSSLYIYNENVDENLNIQCVEYNGASSQVWHNGVLSVSGELGAYVLSGITIGHHNSLATYGADCEIMEVIVYDDEVSDTWRDKITAYLANKWPITATTTFKGYVIRQD